MGLVDNIKRDVKRSGGNKGKFTFFREGEKHRVRFLQDMDEGFEIVFHDSFAAGINLPCQEQFGRECEYCDDDDLRTRSLYAWSVWNYEAKEVQILQFAVNNCSPVPALVAMYENYGTLTDRDYVISVQGKGTSKTFSVIPMDKQKFRNTKAKPFSKKKYLELVDAAWPDENADDDEKPVRKHGKPRRKQEVVDDDDWEDEDEEESVEVDYDSMDAKELFKLCKERGIDVQPRKSQKFYVNALEEYDSAQEDWGDDDDDDDWEDE